MSKIFTFKIDLRAWFNIAQVGSSIYGDLLKPNDIDIAVAIKIPFLYFKKVICLRLFKFNLIIFHGETVQSYVDGFDMSIVKGAYKSLLTRKLHSSYFTEMAFKTKTIKQLERHNNLFEIYEENSNENLLNRAVKYSSKLPTGWKFIPLNDDIAKQLLQLEKTDE